MVTVGLLVRQSVLIAAEMRARKNSLNALYRVFFHCSIIMPVDVGLLLSYSVCYKDRSQRYSDAVCYRARLLPTTSWFMQMAFLRLKRLAISLPTGSLRITLWSRSLDQICMLKWVPVFVYHRYHSLRLWVHWGGEYLSPLLFCSAPPGPAQLHQAAVIAFYSHLCMWSLKWYLQCSSTNLPWKTPHKTGYISSLRATGQWPGDDLLFLTA